MQLGGFCELRRERDSVFAGAGAALARVCRFARDESLSGMEFACGIPGTVGGAVFMNAGAYGKEMKDVVYRSVIMERDGNIGLIDNSGHGFSYRRSAFQNNGGVILETEFRLAPSAQSKITSEMDGYNARRNAGQPMDMPSAGSVFRRPPGENTYVGPMIEGCGLKGTGVGGAMVSEKHAGFIVNTGEATAADVLGLIKRIKYEVGKRFSIELETEIRIIGED
jgi:UDP-N-acetylmuramate dehydrogenase